jgi:hypothetical protein
VSASGASLAVIFIEDTITTTSTRIRNPEAPDLKEARMGYLTGKAISPESARLVQAIADLVASKEVRRRQRGEGGKEKLRRAVEAFVADLLSIHPAPVFIVTNNAAMTGMEVKADTFRTVLTAMIAAGLVEKRAGFRTKGAEWTPGAATSFGPSWAPRFRPTAKLDTSRNRSL